MINRVLRYPLVISIAALLLLPGCGWPRVHKVVVQQGNVITQEMIDKLGPYAELGIDRVILNLNFGLAATETLDAIECFAQEVMPHFTGGKSRQEAAQ